MEAGEDFALEIGWDHGTAGSPVVNHVFDPGAIARELGRRNLQLAREAEISDDLRLYLDQLADDVAALTSQEGVDVDPYLFLAAQGALIRALLLRDSGDAAAARREMRTRLEQMRQVFRDIAEGGPLYEETSASEIARWLAHCLETSQASLAELLGVSTRTLQRWVSEADTAQPEGDDARRVRVVARTVNHLRHSLTAPGVVRWFGLSHPLLDGRRPIDLLDDPAAAEQLSTLAASVRSHSAA
jgi:DNA-binding transcriptional regulator YiaG